MRFRYYFLAAPLALLLSCGKGGGGEEAAVAFAQNPMFITAESAVHDCGLVCNASWEASSRDGWVTVLTESGKAGDPLKIRVSANKDEGDRNASIKVTAGKAGKVLQIVQYGNAASGFVSETKVNLDTFGKSTYISVNAEGGWSFTDPACEWLHLEKKNVSALVISGEVNFTGSARSAAFKVMSDDGALEADITVTQQFSNEKFHASTEYGRRLVYAMGSYIQGVSKDTFTTLTDGVTSFEMSCTLQDDFGGDTQALNRNVYLLAVDMTKATVLATLPDDDDTKIHNRQLVLNQLNALQQKRTNITVWGGTNGDFFGDSTGELVLQGILYRKGVCLKSDFATTVNTVYAVFKDGTARCMNQTDYNSVKANIQEAIGGRQALLWNGITVSYTDPAQHPRTAVGTSSDHKTTWILVVDGREELGYKTGSYSVSYDVLSRILKAAGAADAINLDGGGSSTYVTRSSGGTLTMRNAPGNSGRVPREIMDGLAVVTAK